MKTLKYLIIILVLGLPGLISCHKNLDPIEFTNLSPDNFPNNKEDVRTMVYSMYRPFSAIYYQGIYSSNERGYSIISDMMGGIIDIRGAGRRIGTYGDFFFHKATDRSSYAPPVFDTYISNLNSGTLYLNRIEKAASFLTAEEYTKYQAEIRLLRGWMSFVYYDLFGPMPIIPLETLLNPTSDKAFPRASKEEYVSYIEGDLKFAAQNLPYKPEKLGMVHKGLANMILLRLYLMEKNWPNVKIIAEELMKPEYGYELETDYLKLFGTQNRNSKEIIHRVVCDVSSLVSITWFPFVVPPGYPAPSPISIYGVWAGTWKLYDMYQAGDVRTVRQITSYTSNGILYNRANPADRLWRGPIPQKYDFTPAKGTDFGQDWVIYRYADVLLSWAEAVNNINNGPNALCWEKVNAIRNRSNAGTLNKADFNTKETFNQLILDERIREFYCEGLSRQDLIRHNQLISHKVAVVKYTTTESLTADFLLPLIGPDGKDNAGAAYLYKLPLPITYIQEGKGLVIQNPGY